MVEPLQGSGKGVGVVVPGLPPGVIQIPPLRGLEVNNLVAYLYSNPSGFGSKWRRNILIFQSFGVWR